MSPNPSLSFLLKCSSVIFPSAPSLSFVLLLSPAPSSSYFYPSPALSSLSFSCFFPFGSFSLIHSHYFSCSLFLLLLPSPASTLSCFLFLLPPFLLPSVTFPSGSFSFAALSFFLLLAFPPVATFFLLSLSYTISFLLSSYSSAPAPNLVLRSPFFSCSLFLLLPFFCTRFLLRSLSCSPRHFIPSFSFSSFLLLSPPPASSILFS